MLQVEFCSKGNSASCRQLLKMLRLPGFTLEVFRKLLYLDMYSPPPLSPQWC